MNLLNGNVLPHDIKQRCDTNSRELSSLPLYRISGGKKCSSLDLSINKDVPLRIWGQNGEQQNTSDA